MVTVIQGNNKKKNKAPITAAIVAGMMATVYSKRTLLIQLVDNDIESAEKILVNYTTDERDAFAKKENEITIPIVEEGIDGLMGSIFNQKINNDMLASYCRTIQNLRNKNGKIIKSLLDVIPISQNDNFISNLNGKEEAIQLLIEAVQEEGMYDNVVILVDNGDENVQEMINAYADCSVYCLNQGHETKGKIFGTNIIYVVTDYESDSRYDLKTVMSNYGLTKKDRLLKVERSIHAIDAARDGRLTRFIKANRELPPYDPDYAWSEDMKHLVGAIMGLAAKDNFPDFSWEKFMDDEPMMKEVTSEGRELTAVPEKPEIKEPKKGVFAKVFGKKKGKKANPDEEKLETEDIDVTLPDVDEFELEDDGFEDVGTMASTIPEISTSDVVEDMVVEHIMKNSKDAVSEVVRDNTEKQKKTDVKPKGSVTKKPAATKTKKSTAEKPTAKNKEKPVKEEYIEKAMTKAQLKEALDQLGVKYTTRMTLKELTELYQSSVPENKKTKKTTVKRTVKEKKEQPVNKGEQKPSAKPRKASPNPKKVAEE